MVPGALKAARIDVIGLRPNLEIGVFVFLKHFWRLSNSGRTWPASSHQRVTTQQRGTADAASETDGIAVCRK